MSLNLKGFGPQEVYLKMDEETFGTTDALRMMFNLACEQNETRGKREINLGIGVRKLLSRGLLKPVIHRLSAWLASGRIGRTR